MKVLLIGEASGYTATLARGLRDMGHEVTVASDGSRWMDVPRDIDLSRRRGRMGGALLWLKLRYLRRRDMGGFDVVQLSNPSFTTLLPHRQRVIFDNLCRDNGRVFMTALGTDPIYIKYCLTKDSALEYNEWRGTGFEATPTGRRLMRWLTDRDLHDYAEYVLQRVDGVVSALYEYHMAYSALADKPLAYGGIPIDVDSLPYLPPAGERRPRVLAPYHEGREAEKGTDRLYAVAQGMDRIVTERVTGLTKAAFTERLHRCDAVLDQYWAYTPATTALMAMAMGKTVVTGAHRDAAAFLGVENIPAVDAHAPGLDRRLARALRPGDMQALAPKAREFVKIHNDMHVVARRFTDFWNL